MNFDKITESESNYKDLEQMRVLDLLTNINNEDKTVPLAVEKVIPQIEQTVNKIVSQLKNGGRLFYIGAGTSGRLGIVDASECPPTFGVPFDLVIGIIAGGDEAIRKAVENAEDDAFKVVKDLKEHNINENDFLIGIAASGTTPYVLGGIEYCKQNNIPTAGITCNPDSPLDKQADFGIAPIVGPEFITGSSRMKAGTAQKLVLNMISTATMIQLGHVKGNKMVDMKLSNHKLVNRATYMVMDELNVSEQVAASLIKEFGNVRDAVDNFLKYGK